MTHISDSLHPRAKIPPCSSVWSILRSFLCFCSVWNILRSFLFVWSHLLSEATCSALLVFFSFAHLLRSFSFCGLIGVRSFFRFSRSLYICVRSFFRFSRVHSILVCGLVRCIFLISHNFSLKLNWTMIDPDLKRSFWVEYE